MLVLLSLSILATSLKLSAHCFFYRNTLTFWEMLFAFSPRVRWEVWCCSYVCAVNTTDKMTDSRDKWRRGLSVESPSDLSGGRSGRGFGCGGSASWLVWPCHWTACPGEPCGRSSRQSRSSRPRRTVPRNASATLLWNYPNKSADINQIHEFVYRILWYWPSVCFFIFCHMFFNSLSVSVSVRFSGLESKLSIYK